MTARGARTINRQHNGVCDNFFLRQGQVDIFTFSDRHQHRNPETQLLPICLWESVLHTYVVSLFGAGKRSSGLNQSQSLSRIILANQACGEILITIPLAGMQEIEQCIQVHALHWGIIITSLL